jgi:hypothetical protein
MSPDPGCPSCSHTIDHLGDGWYHCGRCGTLVRRSCDLPRVYIPKLVERCRAFAKERIMNITGAGLYESWIRLGIDESINTPGNRLKGEPP